MLSEREKALEVREEKLRQDQKNLQDCQKNLQREHEQFCKDMDAREEKLQHDREEFEAERSAYCGNTSLSDALCLNIGGTVTTVLRSTLTCVPNSMLASKFSGRWDDNIERDDNGNFFVDHDFSLFCPILSFLRRTAMSNGRKTLVCNPSASAKFDKAERLDFYQLVEYYGLTESMYPTELIPNPTKTENTEIHGLKARSAELTVFDLVPSGHDRPIKSFEVKFGSAQKAAVAWYKTMSSEAVLKMTLELALEPEFDNKVLSKFTHVANEERESFCMDSYVDNLKNMKEIVVRSEDYGRLWSINGAPFQPPSSKEDVDVSLNGIFSSHLIPSVLVEGEFEVTFIELDVET